MSLEVGSAAPDFSLPGGGGRTFSLSGLRGRKVVIYFYPKDDTSGCTKEAQAFSALKGQFAAAETDVIGISPDSPTSHDRFARKYDLALDLASDEGKDVLGAYGVWVEKSMYGRRYMGVERTTFLVDRTGQVAQVWPKVKVPDHAAEVLAAARALA